MFKNTVRAGKPTFDPSTMTLRFANLEMNKQERLVNGQQEKYPYETYDSPCVYSKWGSGVIETVNVILNFDGWGSVTYKN